MNDYLVWAKSKTKSEAQNVSALSGLDAAEVYAEQIFDTRPTPLPLTVEYEDGDQVKFTVNYSVSGREGWATP